MVKSTNKIKQIKNVGRTPPMVPKAGITVNKRRYGCGGKVKKKLTNLYIE